MVRDDTVHNQTPEKIHGDVIMVSKSSYLTVQRKNNSLACLLKPNSGRGKLTRFFPITASLMP